MLRGSFQVKALADDQSGLQTVPQQPQLENGEPNRGILNLHHNLDDSTRYR